MINNFEHQLFFKYIYSRCPSWPNASFLAVDFDHVEAAAAAEKTCTIDVTFFFHFSHVSPNPQYELYFTPTTLYPLFLFT